MCGIVVVCQGCIFMLQVDIGYVKGELLFLGWCLLMWMNVFDKGYFFVGKVYFDGNVEYVDDVIFMYVQGLMQCDVFGYVWYDDMLWNGYDVLSMVGGFECVSILLIVECGIVGCVVLIDIVCYCNKCVFDKGEMFDYYDLFDVVCVQNVMIELCDILLICIGWIGLFYECDEVEFYCDYVELGFMFSCEFVEWFCEMEILNFVIDMMGNEVMVDFVLGVMILLYNVLMCNFGVVFIEVVLFDVFVEDCVCDGQW